MFEKYRDYTLANWFSGQQLIKTTYTFPLQNEVYLLLFCCDLNKREIVQMK